MEKEIRHNFTEEQKNRILAQYYCMREALKETIYDYIKEGKAVLEKDKFGRLTVIILPEKP